MKTQILFSAIVAIIFLNSCATVFQGSKKRVTITSEPATAKIYVNDEYIEKGFAQVKLRRNKTHVVMVKSDDYITRYVTIDNHLQAGWLITDIFIGVLPLVIDACTGAWHTFDKDRYIIQLEKSK